MFTPWVVVNNVYLPMNSEYQKIERSIINDCFSNKLHHALIFHGIKGIGKSEFVQNLAKKITNSEAEIKNNPDILLIKRDLNIKGELKKDITIENVRKINDFISLSSSQSEYRIIIIDSIDNLNHNAANAILKNLEEPSSKVFFFLINHNKEKILDTIKSRANFIEISPPPYLEFSQMIAKNTIDIKEDEISLLFEISGGSTDLALEFYKNNSFEIYKNIIDIAVNAEESNINQSDFLTGLIKKDKDLLLIQQLINLFLSRSVKKSKFLIKKELFSGEEFLLGQYVKENNNIDEIFKKYDNINDIFYNINRLNLDKLHSLTNAISHL